MSETVYLTIGSNVEPRRNLPRALRLLAERLPVLAVSPVYESDPVGAPGGPRFLNAAVAITAELGPQELKEGILRPVEWLLGRVRGDDRNAPRPVDLDIALHGDRVVSDPERGLRVPDPDILRFAHLVLPLADIAPDLLHPSTGTTLGTIAAAFRSDPGIRRVAGSIRELEQRSRLVE
jgi:2-amino-4-hydroxy-6-hydroxymethyldihydropteridine diphosphokinase